MALDYISKTEAEKAVGRKLDGRSRYFLWDGEVCKEERWTAACSGCADDSEYSAPSLGAGCSECGFTGKRRHSYPIPVKYMEENL